MPTDTSAPLHSWNDEGVLQPFTLLFPPELEAIYVKEVCDKANIYFYPTV
jgi:hypothetical protein